MKKIFKWARCGNCCRWEGVVHVRESELKPIAEYIAKMDNVVRYELLNFNPLGGSKREALSQEDPYDGVKPLPPEGLDELRKALSDIKNLEIRIG